MTEGRGFERRVFALALAARLAFLGLWLWKGLAAVYSRDLYYSLALGWLGWGPLGAVDATHPPLYTVFIAGVLWLFRDPSPWPVLLLQCLASAAVPVLVHRLGGRLCPGRPARLAALWTALDPGLVFYTPQLQTETGFILIEMLFFAGLYRLLDGDGRRGWLWLGLLGGLASLWRSVFAAYPAALVYVLRRRLGPRFWLPVALLSAGWLSPIGAWTLRNWLKYEAIVPISAQMGWNLWEGFTLDREEIRRRPEDMAREAAGQGITDPIAMGDYFKRKTLRFLREHPLESAGIILGKLLLYWRPWLYDPHGFWVRLFMSAYFAALLALAALGLWVSRGTVAPRGTAKASWTPIYSFLIYLTAVHSIFFTGLRYRIPLEPFLCLLGALGIEELRKRWKG